MRKMLGIAVVAVLLAAGPASAGEQSGLSLGVRVGYGIPMGDVATGVPLSDQVSGMIPLQLDLGYRFNPNWQLGLYFQYGFATLDDAFCASSGLPGADCSGSNVRFGAQAIYTFASDGFSPWLGLGLGYEWMNMTAEGGGVSLDQQYSGFEYLNFQLGGDFKVSPTFKVGPFVSFSLASYDTVSSSGVSLSIANTATHEWLQIGLKGTFDL